MKKGLFILLGSAAVFSACNKEASEYLSLRMESASRVKTATYGSTVFNYTYDARGRQLTCDNSDGIKRTYAYSIGSIKESVYTNTVFEYFYKNDLNADSLCVRETKSNDPSYEQLYEYNSDRTMAKIITKKSGITVQSINFFYSNGNCDSARFNQNGQWNMTIIKTYYTDQLNVFGNEVFGNEYYGKGNTNMLRSETVVYAGGSSDPGTNFTYGYDGSGRVIKEIACKGNNINNGLYTYY
jgi:hypothetical protein